jgi:ferredoxin-type protein NapH
MSSDVRRGAGAPQSGDATERVAAAAIAEKGWFRAHKWLLARRATQLGVLALFLLGPLAGVWIVKGNLNYSYTLGVLPLTDIYVLAQTLVTGHWPETLALAGGAIVLAFYALVGGRLYCSWVCPVNMVTDAATWLRRRLGIKRGAMISRHTRYWLLVATFVAAAVSGVVVWESLNPVSMLHRGLIFGVGLAWLVVAGVFLFDLLVAPRGWCGHVCPVGAFYGLVGARALVRVSAPRRAQCNDCMDCVAVCPEPQVIMPVLKGEAKGVGPTILPASCTACGRCIDVCSKDVFEFGSRHGKGAQPSSTKGGTRFAARPSPPATVTAER